MSELCFWHDVELESQGECYHCPECGTFFKRINGCLENVTTTAEALWCWHDELKLKKGFALLSREGKGKKEVPASFYRNYDDDSGWNQQG